MHTTSKSLRTAAAALALVFALTAALAGLLACSAEPKTNRLANNVARVYEYNERTSHFYLNDRQIGDDVPGKAYMLTSADGATSLAWVGSTLYFVSEKGTDKLASGIETAELSFDGRVAIWLEEGCVKRYCLDDRSVTVLEEGVSNLIQVSISPKSETILFTVNYAEDSEYVTLIADGSGVREFARGNVYFAVSDDASIIYFYDAKTSGFSVQNGDELYLISKNCSAATNYNFTRDLSEATYTDVNSVNHLFVLSTKADTELGTGFGITEKTDIFSISTISFFTYINDVDSFRSGLWSLKRNIDTSEVYDLGYIDDKGEVEWLAKDAVDYAAVPGGKRVVWVSLLSDLYSAGASSKAKKLASSVDRFVAADGNTVYYTNTNGVLYCVKGTGSPKRVADNVTRIAAVGGKCVFITADGGLHTAEGAKITEHPEITNAVRFDKRAGMVILYANEQAPDDDTLLYDAYITADGETFALAYHGVEP